MTDNMLFMGDLNIEKDVVVHCEWGADGISHLQNWADVFIIVDVLSFSTCVDIVVSKQSLVYPYMYNDETAQVFANEKNAYCAVKRGQPGYALSPASLCDFPANSSLVLPSPNGSTLSLMLKDKIVLTGCLRNASSVANMAAQLGKRIAVIPAGERWKNHQLRVALEDLIGAGAIISKLSGRRSVEAELAVSDFVTHKEHEFNNLKKCISAIELIEHGYSDDVTIAFQYDVSTSVPCLENSIYSNISVLV